MDALGWRLAAVVQGRAPQTALHAYDRERQHGADENILNSARASRFIFPADGIERLLRDLVLALAATAPSPARWTSTDDSTLRAALAAMWDGTSCP